MKPPHLPPWELGEFTYPQLRILANAGQMPRPRRRRWASVAAAERAVLGPDPKPAPAHPEPNV